MTMNYPATSGRGIKRRKPPKKTSPQSGGVLDPPGIKKATTISYIPTKSTLEKLIFMSIMYNMANIIAPFKKDKAKQN